MKTIDRPIHELMKAVDEDIIQFPDFHHGWVWADYSIKPAFLDSPHEKVLRSLSKVVSYPKFRINREGFLKEVVIISYALYRIKGNIKQNNNSVFGIEVQLVKYL